MYDNKDKWKLIVKIHNLTKTLVILSEELDPNHQFYFPIIIQQRDCLEHIVRAYYAWLNPESLKESKNGIFDSKEYIERQLEKALGHIYRAFFDAADWISILYREQISEIMSIYSLKTINTVFPNYCKKITPKIDKISMEIANIRNSKDIAHTNEVFGGVDHYMDLIHELAICMDEVRGAQPELNKFELDETMNNS